MGPPTVYRQCNRARRVFSGRRPGRPAHHKTAHRGIDRSIPLAPARATPARCGNTVGSNRVGNPRKGPGDRYTTQTYGRAVAYACEAAFPASVPLRRGVGESRPDWPPRGRSRSAWWRRGMALTFGPSANRSISSGG